MMLHDVLFSHHGTSWQKIEAILMSNENIDKPCEIQRGNALISSKNKNQINGGFFLYNLIFHLCEEKATIYILM